MNKPYTIQANRLSNVSFKQYFWSAGSTLPYHLRSWIWLLFGFLFITNTQAQFVDNVSKVGTTAANFLEIGIGARAVAVGGAFAAMTDDISALYWNPAGLHHINNFELLMNHVNWIIDINLDYFGLAKNIPGIGVLGFSVTAVTMDEMKVRTVTQPDGTGERFSSGDFAFQLTFAKKITDRFALGVSVKSVYEHIWHMNSHSFAMDFGTMYRTDLNGMILGMSISNFGSSMKMIGSDNEIFADVDKVNGGNNDKIRASLESGRFPLPLLFRFGIMLPLHISEEQLLRLTIDGIHPNNNYESVNVGMEYTYSGKYSVRAGYNSLFLKDGEGGLTIGAGLNLSPYENFALLLDYAWQDLGRLNNMHFFSISLKL